MAEPEPIQTGTPPFLRFNLRELAGSLGDLGTLLPIGIGLILINGLDATAVLLMVGLYFIASGLYFRTTVPVQPMKVIGAYAIARSLPAEQITAAGLWMGVILLGLALTGAISLVGRVIPKSAVRGVQLTTGILLMTGGIRFILGNNALQKIRGAAEPNLTLDSIGPIPIGILLGTAAIITILFLLENNRAPAALVVIAAGITIGVIFQGHLPVSLLNVIFGGLTGQAQHFIVVTFCHTETDSTTFGETRQAAFWSPRAHRNDHS